MFGRNIRKGRGAGHATLDNPKPHGRQTAVCEPLPAETPEGLDAALEQFREQWDGLGTEFRERQDQCISALIALCERLQQRRREQAETLEALQREAAQWHDQRDQWAAEIAELRDQREQGASEATQLREQRDALASEGTQLREQRDALASEAARLRDERDRLASEAAQLGEQHNQLASELHHRQHASDESLAQTQQRDRSRNDRPAQPAGETGVHDPHRSAEPKKTPPRERPEIGRRDPAGAAKTPAPLPSAPRKNPRPTPRCVEGARVRVFPDNDQHRIDARLHEVSAAAVSLVLPKPLKVGEYVIIEMDSASQRIEVEVRAFVRQVEPLADGRYLIGFALITQLEFREVQGLRSN